MGSVNKMRPGVWLVFELKCDTLKSPIITQVNSTDVQALGLSLGPIHIWYLALIVLIKMNGTEKQTDFRPYPSHIIQLRPGWLLVPA